MKTVRIIGICLFMIVLALPGNSFSETAPAEVTRAAEDGLIPFLRAINPGELAHFGLLPAADLGQAHPGDPFRVYTITPDRLFGGDAGTPVNSLISATGMWLFPVIFKDEVRAMLTVELVNGAGQAVSLGKAPLARELVKVRSRWPKSRGYKPKLVVVYQASAYLFTLPQKGDSNLTPLTFAGKGFGRDIKTGLPEYSSPVPLAEVIEPLQTAVQDNLIQQNF